MNSVPNETPAAAPATNRTDTVPASGPAAVARSTLIVLAIVGCAWLLVELNRFFLLVFAAIVLGAVFDAITDRICRWTGIARPYGLSLAIVAFLSVFVGAFALFGAQLAGEFDTIRNTVPTAIEGLQGFLERYGMGSSVSELAQLGSDDVSRLFTQAGGFALAAGNGIADFVLVLVGAIFMAANPDVYRRGFLLLMPDKAEAIAAQALDDTGKALRGWMMGQAISSLLVAALTWIGLWLLGVPAAGGLGVIAGLLDIIPMVGPIIAGVPAVLLAFTVSPLTALWTLLLFLAIQQLQGNFLQPMIQKHAVDIPTALLLFSVLAFGLLFGFLGVLLAAPLTIVSTAIVINEYGSVAGMVTLEDALEEVFGEIQDEFDQEEDPVIARPDGRSVRGDMNLAALADRYDIDLPDDRADTIGGLVWHELGRLPGVGDTVDLPGTPYNLKVETMAGYAVQRVLVRQDIAPEDEV